MPSQESVGTSSGPFDSDPFATSSQRSRIHFPVDETSPSRPIYRPTEQASRVSPVASKKSPARRNSPLNPHHISAAERRRVRSVGTSEDVFADSPLSRRKHTSSLMTPPRGLNSIASRGFQPVEEDHLGLSLFSDEYDLAHEDPRILQDVQRALKLKARREARLSNKSTPPKSEIASYRPATSASSAIQYHVPVSPTSRKGIITSDLDFGPSTTTSYLHPVPASLDNGITLDWSGFDDKPESRWKLTGPKRKEKEVVPPIVMEQQETAYADKLARLKAVTTPQTLRKAKITQDQLGRRYNLTFDSLYAGVSLNINKVARWYSQQDDLIRNSLEKAEPFTWLKHLERRGAKPPGRCPWNISALIAEEYIQAQNLHDSMATIPEDSPLREISPDALLSPSFVKNQLAPSPSRTSSNNLLGPSIARKASFDGGATFEPRVDSTRTSLDVDTHHRSYESSFSSLPIGLSSTAPNSPNFNLTLASRLQQKSRNEYSFERLLSEESDHAPAPNSRMLSPDLKFEVVAASSESENEALQQSGITMQLTAPAPSNVDAPRSQVVRLAAPSQPSHGRILGTRRVRRSFPTMDRTSKSSEAKQRREADEEKAHDVKTRLLEQAAANNHRIRQVLNRVSVGIREFESARSNAMASLGIAHIGLPRELIDAFGHDPAAVTGATRRFTGWRAVDDIQNRLIRQRDVFQSFLSSASSDVSVPKSVLDDPISSLVQSLEALEIHGQKIAGRAIEVFEALKSVQTTHVEVKEDYKGTLSRVSVVYPELSYIVALEESYKDQYQQFWEFGMDTLTFLLDSVTPFWRTYGKPIGEDIRDFLIIPLYRNEFTGESKRYPILRVPSRSFRHWSGLVLFFFASVSVNILQARAALSSSTYYKLPMIPYESLRWTALPFFWISIVIQWWAVLVEFLIVFLQLAVVFWWVGWSIRIYS